MVLRTWRHLMSRSRLQWTVIIVTIFVPVAFSLLPPPTTVGPFESPKFLPFSLTVESFVLPTRDPVFVVPAFLFWGLFVVFLVPTAFKEDRSHAEQSIDRKLEGPIRDIQEVKDELERTKTGLQEQLAEMSRVMRSGFEQVRVALPPSQISLGATASTGMSTDFVTEHFRGPRTPIRYRVIRTQRWVTHDAPRILKRFWKWFWG